MSEDVLATELILSVLVGFWGCVEVDFWLIFYHVVFLAVPRSPPALSSGGLPWEDHS